MELHSILNELFLSGSGHQVKDGYDVYDVEHVETREYHEVQEWQQIHHYDFDGWNQRAAYSLLFEDYYDVFQFPGHELRHVTAARNN